jgi:hypothetical protein
VVRRGERAGDPDDLALALLTALQGGLLMTQIQRTYAPWKSPSTRCWTGLSH